MKKAVIILGAGVAGKLAAKLLAQQDHKVTLVDPQPGKVFQSDQLHVLLAGGMKILQQHFPQTFAELERTCPRIDWGGDSYWHSPVGLMPSKENDVVTHTCTRVYLDRLMFEELIEFHRDEVKVVEAKVTGLLRSDGKSKIDGVQTTKGNLTADLVIDAMGRTTKMHHWLKDLTGSALQTSRMDTSLQYSTTMGRFKNLKDTQQAYAQIDPQTESFGGVILPVERGRVIATSIYIEPEKGEMFEQVADQKFNEIANCLDLDDRVKKISKLHNVRYHYEKYRRLPTNLFLIGDSVCQFNPVFGQGMTQAMRGAVMVAEQINAGCDQSLDFQKKLHKDLYFPWMMATMDPYNRSVKLGVSQKLTRWWVYKQMRLAKGNDEYRDLFIRVLHMLESPVGMYRFKWLLKALKA